MAEPKPERIIKLEEVLARTSLGRSTVYDMAAKGTFPRPINLTSRSIGWVESEVDEWLARKISSRALPIQTFDEIVSRVDAETNTAPRRDN